MKILIVDDEALIRNVIKEYCEAENFEVIEAENGIQAIEIVSNDAIDLIVLDVMMPKLNGLSAFKEIKKLKNIPTIMLSARKEEFDKLTGFDLGVDDYVTKPFSPKELIARIKAVLKRTKNIDNIYIYNDLKMDFKGRVVTVENKELKLTPKEFDLLNYFIQNKGIALSREQLLSNVWGYDFFGDDRTIDTHIKMLRNNLGKYRNLITTVRGVGYKYNET
ncbi:MAG: response regulator transcription factor [Candidatus Amulumruptor caecigallinarius]|nr:response regulator transcription factor [Candidatus Amulumruptor caecigallinarius]